MASLRAIKSTKRAASAAKTKLQHTHTRPTEALLTISFTPTPVIQSCSCEARSRSQEATEHKLDNVRGPRVRRIALLQVRQAPVLARDGAAASRTAARAFGDAIELRLRSGIVIRDFLASFNVAERNVQ